VGGYDRLEYVYIWREFVIKILVVTYPGTSDIGWCLTSEHVCDWWHPPRHTRPHDIFTMLLLFKLFPFKISKSVIFSLHVKSAQKVSDFSGRCCYFTRNTHIRRYIWNRRNGCIWNIYTYIYLKCIYVLLLLL